MDREAWQGTVPGLQKTQTRLSNTFTFSRDVQYFPMGVLLMCWMKQFRVVGNMLVCVLRPKWFQSCPTLCNRIVYGLPGSSIHGILQAKII